MIHNSETMMAMPGIKVMELIKITEAKLLDTEGHYAAAEAMYQELLRNPRITGLIINYQAHLVIMGNFTEAHQRFRSYAPEHPADTYRSIMADLTARRLGLRETEILEVARRNIRAELWPSDGVRFLLGQLDDAGLLENARQGTRLDIANRECEAYFWLGEVALAEGRKEDGIKWLSRCVGSGMVLNIEYEAAKAELQRLAPRQEKQKPGLENSNGVITT
jgi:lipoprotein NlpI